MALGHEIARAAPDSKIQYRQSKTQAKIEKFKNKTRTVRERDAWERDSKRNEDAIDIEKPKKERWKLNWSRSGSKWPEKVSTCHPKKKNNSICVSNKTGQKASAQSIPMRFGPIYSTIHIVFCTIIHWCVHPPWTFIYRSNNRNWKPMNCLIQNKFTRSKYTNLL